MTGYNTDDIAVADLLGRNQDDPAMPFVLRGARARAEAVANALRDAGHRRGTIVARNETKGRALADLYGFDWSKAAEGLTASLPINATPLGMAGPDVQTPAFNSIAIAAADITFDVVALPVETPLDAGGASPGPTPHFGPRGRPSSVAGAIRALHRDPS